MGNQWTAAQQKAIEHQSGNLLISAAAGSGKTSVLVEHIIQLITNTQNATNINELLIVTYTKAAANEMKTRIGNKLTGLIEENPHDENLRKQLLLLNKSHISTMHSFCMDVVRQNFNIVNIDPAFKIADPQEIELLKNEVIEALFEDYYQHHEDFLILIESFEKNYMDTYLRDIILELFDFIQSSPSPELWLKDAAEKFSFKTGDSLSGSQWEKIVLQIVAEECGGMLAASNTALSIISQSEQLLVYQPTFEKNMEIAQNLAHCTDFESAYNVITRIKFSNLPPSKKIDPIFSKQLAALHQQVKSAANSLEERFFFKPSKELIQDMRLCYPIIKTLCQVTLDFSEQFFQAKLEKGILSFDDLEHLCIQILLTENEEGLRVPSPVAEGYQKQFKEVMTDEYQDINLVQEAILKAVSNQNRFMVGDIKQCIYQFRQAKPALFLEKYSDYRQNPQSKGVVIDLYDNFRSHRNILDCANYLFSQLMTAEFSNIQYDENAALHHGSALIPQLPDAVEVLLLEGAKTGFSQENADSGGNPDDIHIYQMEATAIINKIYAMTADKNFKVYDPHLKKFRSVQFGDIAILLRSAAGTSELFSNALTQAGIPVYTEESKQYFDSIEVMVILNILKIIDNPIQDIPLISVLLSPVVGLSNDDLLKIKKCSDKKSFYHCMLDYPLYSLKDPLLEDKIQSFGSLLSRLRLMAGFLAVHELISVIYENTGYYDMVGLMPGSKLRQQNLHALIDYAIQFQETSYSGLFHFLRYIDRIKNSKPGTRAKTDGDNHNFVRITTIHKSKGLEFPVVFVAAAGKKFNLTDVSASILLHEDFGFGPNCIDYEKRTVCPTIAKECIAFLMKRSMLAEELRILYVALTRAKEKLFIVGAVQDIGKHLDNWQQGIHENKPTLPVYYLSKCRCILDWVMPALMRHPCFEPLSSQYGIPAHPQLDLPYLAKSNFKISIFTREALFIKASAPMEQIDISGLSLMDNPVENELYTAISAQLDFKYPFSEAVTYPAKVSIAEIKSRYQPEETTGAVTSYEPGQFSNSGYDRPQFLRSKSKLTASEKGTVMHKIMANIDFKQNYLRQDLVNLTGALVANSLLTQNEASVIEYDPILAFFKSPLCSRMRQAQNLYQEIPFVFGVPPSEIGFHSSGNNDADEEILIHGIIDCFFQEQHGMILLDYKTDYITQATKEAVIQKYILQMSIYKKALESLNNLPVAECYLYFFGIGEAVQISV